LAAVADLGAFEWADCVDGDEGDSDYDGCDDKQYRHLLDPVVPDGVGSGFSVRLITFFTS
jgi:hypothetical protein